ncbi:MAG TPA: hypothetical protein VFB12_22800 [Ktedonobacteraceae bacterium]|nr:hypothetical protein [Ktedonobacteraceae bacterium]
MTKAFHMFLVTFAVLALLAVGADLTYSIVATTHGRTPARVVQVQAGPYPLVVSLYTDPAHAGYAMPFAVAPAQPVDGTLSYQVTSIPSRGDVSATAVRATISPDASVRNGIQGDAEITVQGRWTLQITVIGPAGTSEAAVPLIANAVAPAIPGWLAWLIGGVPFYALLVFLLASRWRKPFVQPYRCTAKRALQ